MRHSSKKNPRTPKDVARRQYKLRQMDKFISWSLEVKGYLKWRDLVEQQDYLNIQTT